ncbi:DUF4142 domain-containing protein [Micromonospora sp. NPDC049559]|uniref:DUF4142 domain-containing protein n=1 Tax=Micromonospora sp. NPDC049559 TaxID=3155923 RepID=UPI003435A0A3
MLGFKHVGLLAGLAVFGLAPVVTMRAAAAPPAQDTQFLETIHQVNLYQITSGNLAEQRGGDATIQTLGARFVTDHAKLDGTVKSTAASTGVTLPDAPTTDQQNRLAQEQNLNGNAFDRQWVTTQLTLDVAVMQAAQTELSAGSDGSVKQVARDTVALVQSHHQALLAAAKKLNIPVPGGASVLPTPSPSGTPSPGPSGSPSGSGSPAPSDSGTPGPSVTSNAPSPGVS